MDKQVLRNLWLKYGESVIFEPKVLRAYLLDMHIPKKTINLLIDISRLQYFKQFAKEINKDTSAKERLIYNIEDEYVFDKSAIIKAVDYWVFAFTGNVTSSLENKIGIDANLIEKSTLSDDETKMMVAAIRELMK